MIDTHYPGRGVPLALLALAALLPLGAVAQSFAPLDAGTTVHGFQDDFTGTALNSNWVASGTNVFSLTNGLLRVANAGGDPNHLLYEWPGYDKSTQEVLVRMRVAAFAPDSFSRGGVSVAVNGGPAKASTSLSETLRAKGNPGRTWRCWMTA